MSTLKSSAEDLTLNADGSGNDIKFQSNGVEKASIDQAGNVVASGTISSTGDTTITSGNLVIGTAGKGIDFSANTEVTGMTSEVFDYYEEGVHTSTAIDTGGGATYGLAGANETLAYTRIGRVVTITGVLVCNSVTGTPTGTVQISLPFTCINTTDTGGKSGGAGIGYYQVQKYTSGVYPQMQLSESNDKVSLYYGVVDANQYNCYLNTSSQLYVNFSYFTA